MKTYEIECETHIEKRWFEVEAADENDALDKLIEMFPGVEGVIRIKEVQLNGNTQNKEVTS